MLAVLNGSSDAIHDWPTAYFLVYLVDEEGHSCSIGGSKGKMGREQRVDMWGMPKM